MGGVMAKDGGTVPVAERGVIVQYVVVCRCSGAVVRVASDAKLTGGQKRVGEQH